MGKHSEESPNSHRTNLISRLFSFSAEPGFLYYHLGSLKPFLSQLYFEIFPPGAMIEELKGKEEVECSALTEFLCFRPQLAI